MSEETHLTKLKKLTDNNYRSWAYDISAFLRSKGIWDVVQGTRPAPATPSLEATQKVMSDKEIALGYIQMALSESQQPHIYGLDNPAVVWTTLKTIHNQKTSSTRFVAYNALFSVGKQEDESLMSLSTRVLDSVQKMKDLRPDPFTLDQLDEDLTCMTLIRALPPGFETLSQSLLNQSSLTKKDIINAFRQHDITHSAGFKAPESAFKSFATIPKFPTSSLKPKPPVSSTPTIICEWCEKEGHSMSQCYTMQNMQKKARERTASGRSGRKKQQQKANQVTTDVALDSDHVESAGNASISSFSSSSSSSPYTVTDWNTDTGATAHMTPHRHWFVSYTPFRVPVRLADESVIFSAGVGYVQFAPVVNGKKTRTVEFEQVLHVPDLRCNLLSVFSLTRHKGYIVEINNNRVHFRRDGQLLFTATINDKNTGLLDGSPIVQLESAGAASTCPMDLTLWHRRFCHRNLDDVKKVQRDSLATGMIITSKSTPDPICVPCISGNQHRPPVPKSATRATDICDLVHSDVHGPLPVQTREGYRYWVTFIDDKSRYWVVVPLRSKADVFDAFKRYQAYAETQTGRKIKAFRNDKGGEYVSNEFKAHLAKCGIALQQTLRNEPHQNGVAERANRTLAEGIISLLTESNLPPSFWCYALNAFVHCINPPPICCGRIWNTLLCMERSHS